MSTAEYPEEMGEVAEVPNKRVFKEQHYQLCDTPEFREILRRMEYCNDKTEQFPSSYGMMDLNAGAF